MNIIQEVAIKSITYADKLKAFEEGFALAVAEDRKEKEEKQLATNKRILAKEEKRHEKYKKKLLLNKN